MLGTSHEDTLILEQNSMVKLALSHSVLPINPLWCPWYDDIVSTLNHCIKRCCMGASLLETEPVGQWLVGAHKSRGFTCFHPGTGNSIAIFIATDPWTSLLGRVTYNMSRSFSYRKPHTSLISYHLLLSSAENFVSQIQWFILINKFGSLSRASPLVNEAKLWSVINMVLDYFHILLPWLLWYSSG